jgi:CIC family chloride channel protein
MAAFLAASHRTPMAGIFMACELGGSYTLLIPSLWTCGTAFLLGGRRTLIPSQVWSDADSGAHSENRAHDPFAEATVGQLLPDEPPARTLLRTSSLADCRTILAETGQTVFPVLDDRGALLGIVSLDELRQHRDDTGEPLQLGELLAGRAVALRPDDRLSRALRRFAEHPLDDLPVVNEGGLYIGLLRRESLFRWYHQRMERVSSELRAEGLDPVRDISRTSTAIENPGRRNSGTQTF